MSKTTQFAALAVGIGLATVAGVAIFLYMDNPAEDVAPGSESTQAAVVAGAEKAPDPVPAQVAEGDYEEREGGLKIADLVVGTGAEPVAGQMLEMHYSGWLQSTGKMFDSSVAAGRPPLEFQFVTGGVIQGWHKGIAGMKVGGKRQLVIPPDLAYGPQGRPPRIPPASTLIFDVELVGLGDIREVPAKPTLDFDADPTVVSLDEGVKVADLKTGDGAVIVDRTPVTAEVTIWKPDGEVFFSSWSQRGPVKYLIGGKGQEAAPLKGIELASMGMAAGGSRIARVPPAAAFGEEGFRDQMPPNATVLLQVDVVEVGPARVVPTEKIQFDASALQTTESGLQYLDLVVGTGETPEKGEMVVAEYAGWLDDGTLFDTSFKRRSGHRFPLGRGAVIPAWDEAVATMKVGGKRVIVAPAELAYGDRGQGEIPPGATLTFVIELVEVMKKQH